MQTRLALAAEVVIFFVRSFMSGCDASFVRRRWSSLFRPCHAVEFRCFRALQKTSTATLPLVTDVRLTQLHAPDFEGRNGWHMRTVGRKDALSAPPTYRTPLSLVCRLSVAARRATVVVCLSTSGSPNPGGFDINAASSPSQSHIARPHHCQDLTQQTSRRRQRAKTHHLPPLRP